MSQTANFVNIDSPWASSVDHVLQSLETTSESGLTEDQVRQRRQKCGPNRLRKARHQSARQILVNQFKSLIVLLLVAAAIASFAFGEIVEGIAVVAVILINAAIGFVTELRAVRSMEALQELGSVQARVRRSGKVQEIDAEALVPGDIVLIDGGDIVTADLRLIEASKLQADESALTGESVPVSKGIELLEGDKPLAERANMLFKGTAVTRGAGEGVVVATGMNTELGRISSLVEEAEEQVTPLEKRLDQLGQKLVWVTLAIAIVLVITGLLAGKEPLLIIETAIALAVATVPEGLPIVATVALARGMWRMAQRSALVNRLSAVETLGATNVICTDKTGTLTENQMTVTEIWLHGGTVQVSGEGLALQGDFHRNGQALAVEDQPILRDLLEAGVLCNNATVQRDGDGAAEGAMGEPIEVALLVAGAKANLRRSDLLEQAPERREVAFDPDVKMMATFHQRNGGYRVAVKGAPEAVLQACQAIRVGAEDRSLDEDQRDVWQARNKEMAEEGLRILALAEKTVNSTEVEPYDGLTLLGLVGLLDPPREEVRPSIRSCQEAGVRIVMVTGDHPVTAGKIALAVNLVDQEQTKVLRGRDIKRPEEASQQEQQRIREATILARVSPAQKLDLIALHQQTGAVVAMTGDGVNDAPALKKADIGIAMGRRGTQVAKEAADMVLKDDAFSTIVAAIQQGRVIFENIRKFVLYLMSCNSSEILVVSLASLANAPLPIRPLQILFLNLVTDVFPALALGVGEGDEAIMRHPPRDPDEPILTRQHWWAIAGYGTLITVAVLAVFFLALIWLDMGTDKAVTISFLTLAFAQMWHVFNMREPGSGLLRNEITLNPYVWAALLLCTVLLIAAVYMPGLSDVLKTVDPGLDGWLLVLGASLVPLLVGQISKIIKSKTEN